VFSLTPKPPTAVQLCSQSCLPDTRDFAAPGQRAWDVTFAVYRFVPLVPDQGAAELGAVLPVDRPGRLRGDLIVDQRSLREPLQEALEAAR
jgi:hypothetical protein